MKEVCSKLKFEKDGHEKKQKGKGKKKEEKKMLFQRDPKSRIKNQGKI